MCESGCCGKLEGFVPLEDVKGPKIKYHVDIKE